MVVRSSPNSVGVLNAAGTFPLVARTEATYVLRGRVVTLDGKSNVIESGNVCIRGDAIEAVISQASGLPAGFNKSPVIATSGTIFPGLVDVHNHFAYNIRELWKIPDRYDNRQQWQATAAYRNEVSAPCRAIANNAVTAKALVRFIETKAVVGGATTGQGIKSRINGQDTYFDGVMRNVERPNDPRLPQAATRIPDLKEDSDFIEFDNWLKTRRAVFYHLCEGIDAPTRAHFETLAQRNLIQPPFVGIHALALTKAQFQTLAARGSKVIWSPLSNLLLYGSTLDVLALFSSGVDVSVGCDWSPSGSKNLLMEVKAARHVLDHNKVPYTTEDLVRMMTTRPARSAGWDQHVGSIEPGKLADLLVLRGDNGDPYEQLIGAIEEDIDLVLVGGTAVFGLTGLMRQLAGEVALELFPDSTREKFLNVLVPGSGIEDVTLAAARTKLTEAMANPQNLADHELRILLSRSLEARAELESFQVLLDNEHPDEQETYYEHLLTLRDSGVPLTLDTMIVGSSDLARLDAQDNIDHALKTSLRKCYN